MRISTKTMFDTGTNQMNALQAALNKTQMQLSTNKKNLTAADDPIASARALQVIQSQSLNTQLVTNRSNAKTALNLENVALTSTNELISDVQEMVVKAGNATYLDVDRQSIATEMEGRLNDLMGIANSVDGSGGYLFSGYKTTTVPYSPNATGATYQGDQGQTQLQVGAQRSVPTADPGSAVFDGNLTGNGKFVTAADPGNFTRGGAGIISGGTVSDATKLTGDNYAISFKVVPADPTTNTAASTTYTVMDTTLNQPVPATPVPAVDIPYTSGSTIEFDGQQFTITGVPADGDQFTTAPSTKESVFTTIKDLIALLRSPGTGAAGQASLTNGLSRASQLLATASNNVLSVTADVGSRLKELDYLDTSGDDLNIQYATTLSGLQDLDTVAAISLFTQQQTTLTAAQKAFTATSNLSLFNYIS